MYVVEKKLNNKIVGTIVPSSSFCNNKKMDFRKKKKISFESKRQAFKKASELAFFNTDMKFFVTLTYKKQHKNYQKVLNDIKNLTRKEPKMKYIGVVEKHKSENLHVHLITNELKFVSLRKGKLSVENWKCGFSDVKRLEDTDDNFSVLKYLFKYIKKSDKIGGRWVLKSRNLDKPEEFKKELDNRHFSSYLQVLRQKYIGLDVRIKKVILYNNENKVQNNFFITKFNN